MAGKNSGKFAPGEKVNKHRFSDMQPSDFEMMDDILTDETLTEWLEGIPGLMEPEQTVDAQDTLSDEDLLELSARSSLRKTAPAGEKLYLNKTKNKAEQMHQPEKLPEVTQPSQPEEKPKAAMAKTLVGIVALILGLLMSAMLTGKLLLGTGTPSKVSAQQSNKAIMDRYEMYMTNEIASALDGVVAIEKVYWLNDSDLTAPKPDYSHYGQVDTPADLMWLLEEAKDLIGDRQLTFNENTPVWEHDKIYYYYDDTILVITWKQSMDGVIHTVSEVIIAHASQLRRALAGGEFGSDKQFFATDIAQSVNAVVATSGDFYKFRRNGVIVYNGQLRRFEGELVDTCFIDDQGDLLFVKRNEILTEADAKKYIADHNVRFSLAFGPVMVENGRNVTPASYEIGEINGRYTRSAIAQKGQLHYLLVNTSSYMDLNLTERLKLKEFSDNLIELGAQNAYALDGGQTTVITMCGDLISRPDFEHQRQISDIIYFATAIPNGD